MSDSPFSAAPLPANEKPILDPLLIIRDKLLLLKEDKSTHVKSADVLPLYDQVIELVHKLNDVRTEHELALNRGGSHVSVTACLAHHKVTWKLKKCSGYCSR
jgi:hypothetical protein